MDNASCIVVVLNFFVYEILYQNSGGWASVPPQPYNKLAFYLCQLDPLGTLLLLQDEIKLVRPRMQAVIQVALKHRATMLCESPQNTVGVISW